MSARSNRAIPFTRAGLLEPVIDFLERRGISTTEYLQQEGIPPELLGDPSAPLPLAFIYQFINTASAAAGITDIGLVVGQNTSVQMLGRYGEALLASRDIGDYLAYGSATINQAASGDYFWLAKEHEGVRFCQSVSSLSAADKVQEYLYINLITINTISQIIGEPWCPLQITIPAMRQSTAEELAKLLPTADIVDTGPHASILLPRNILSTPMQGGKEASRSPLFQSAKQLPEDFVNSILLLIETMLQAGQCDVGRVAVAAGISTRTLQRRLAGCNVGYKQLVTRAIKKIACQLLQDLDRPIASIAVQLGYSDPANFSRAFRGHFGQSPNQYRRSLTPETTWTD